MVDIIDDYYLLTEAEKRRNDGEGSIRVDIDGKDKKINIYKLVASKSLTLLSDVKLLIKDGFNVNQKYNKDTPLLYAVRLAKFDLIKLLIKEGADKEELKWTNTFYAVLFGDLDDLRKSIHKNGDIKIEDYCGRTPWLYAVMSGNIEKARLLIESGVDIHQVGWTGISPLEYVVVNNRVDMLDYLVRTFGFDIESVNCVGETPLIVAARESSTECFKLLLSYGAEINPNDERAIEMAANMEIVNILLKKGEDIKDISCEMRAKLLRTQCNGKPSIDKSKYVSGRHRTFGRNNPENKNEAFWVEMVKSGATAWSARAIYNDEDSLDNPIWCYERFGRTTTILNDGRIVEIGGEHEDYYDADFCIYNDVTVFKDNEITIYSYPVEVFPPTDFHTATLIDKHIYIIGSLGYYDKRNLGHTPVYRLNTLTYKIEPIKTTGSMPGWIHKHKALFDGKEKITITQGSIEVENKKDFANNKEKYELNLRNCKWKKIQKNTHEREAEK